MANPKMRNRSNKRLEEVYCTAVGLQRARNAFGTRCSVEAHWSSPITGGPCFLPNPAGRPAPSTSHQSGGEIVLIALIWCRGVSHRLFITISMDCGEFSRRRRKHRHSHQDQGPMR